MICNKCKVNYSDIENTFYAHGEDTHGIIRRDVVCKFCRRAEMQERRALEKIKPQSRRREKDLSCARRNTPEAYMRYMINNPYYYVTEVDNREPTKDNIMASFRDALAIRAKFGTANRE